MNKLKTNKILKDSYGIFHAIDEIDLSEYPKLMHYATDIRDFYTEYGRNWALRKRLKEIMNISKWSTKNPTVGFKYLLTYADGSILDYDRSCARVFPNKYKGLDYDCWKAIRSMGAIELDHKGKYGRQFYRISELGKEIVELAKSNDPVMRVLRWFKGLDEDEAIVAMMQADLNGEESYKDQDPETIEAMFEALFNPESNMHKIGSHFFHMNAICRLLQENSQFMNLLDQPHAYEWLEAHNGWEGTSVFKAILQKEANRWEKKAAKAAA